MGIFFFYCMENARLIQVFANDYEQAERKLKRYLLNEYLEGDESQLEKLYWEYYNYAVIDEIIQ